MVRTPRSEVPERDSLSEAIVEHALDAIVTIDESGHLVDFNPSAERIFGYRRDEVLGREIAELIIPPALRERHRAGMARYLAGGARRILGQRIEIEGMRADGSPVPVELTVTEVAHDGRRLFTASLRDLTERREAEAEIARQRETLTHAEKLNALGSLLASVAHELNNPLSVLVGQSALLASGVDDPALRERIERIRRAAERCSGIVRSFLAIARREEPRREVCHVNALVRNAVELLEYSLRTSDIRVETSLADEVAPLDADPDQLGQVLVNLVVNAQQALLERPDERRLRVSTCMDSAGSVVVSVEDNGPGIEPAIRSRIFEPFFTTKSEGAGTGLGLAVSRAIVANHGGALVVEQTPSGGARFVMRLGTRASSEPPFEPVDEPPSTVRALTVLVVEDEAEVADLLRDVLAARGHAVTIAASGRAALDALRERDFDAIVSDLRMRDLDGPALYRTLLDEHPKHAERIGFLTGDTLGSATGGFLERAGRPWRAKPFLPVDIVELVEEIAGTAR